MPSITAGDKHAHWIGNARSARQRRRQGVETPHIPHPATGNTEGDVMHEWCSCGSSIRARRKDVLTWRDSHRCNKPTNPEPDKQGTESRVEHAGERRYDQIGPDDHGQDVPVYIAQIGFRPNA